MSRLKALCAGLNIDCEIWTTWEAGHVAVAVITMSHPDSADFCADFCVIHNQDHHDPVPRAERTYTWFVDSSDATKLAQDLFDGFTMTPAEIKSRRQVKRAMERAAQRERQFNAKNPGSVTAIVSDLDMRPWFNATAKEAFSIHPEDQRLMDSMKPNMAAIYASAQHRAAA